MSNSGIVIDITAKTARKMPFLGIYERAMVFNDGSFGGISMRQLVYNNQRQSKDACTILTMLGRVPLLEVHDLLYVKSYPSSSLWADLFHVVGHFWKQTRPLRHIGVQTLLDYLADVVDPRPPNFWSHLQKVHHSSFKHLLNLRNHR